MCQRDYNWIYDRNKMPLNSGLKLTLATRKRTSIQSTLWETFPLNVPCLQVSGMKNAIQFRLNNALDDSFLKGILLVTCISYKHACVLHFSMFHPCCNFRSTYRNTVGFQEIDASPVNICKEGKLTYSYCWNVCRLLISQYRDCT